MKKGLKFIGILVLCAILIGAYATKIEPHISVVREYLLGKVEAENQIRVVQLSDIQIGEGYTTEDLKRLIQKVNQAKPDIFIFTGDLYENYGEYGPEQEVIRELAAIVAPYGKYAVWGNRDYGGGAKRRYEEILKQSGIQLLENSDVVVTTPEDHTIWIGGLDDYLLGNPDIKPLLSGMNAEADYHILLTHEPDTADFYVEYDLDLILSGHSHGGQVRLPFWDGITTAMAEKYTAGFYQMENKYQTQLFVNTGVGTSHYSIRFLVPPEITVFNIGL